MKKFHPDGNITLNSNHTKGALEVVNPAVDVLNRVEVLIRAGQYNAAIQLLSSYPQVYEYVVNLMIQALRSYPGGYIADTNGNLWPTSQLIRDLQRGNWSNRVLFNLLLSEIEIARQHFR